MKEYKNGKVRKEITFAWDRFLIGYNQYEINWKGEHWEKTKVIYFLFWRLRINQNVVRVNEE